ncbi:MAG: hypothetical protein Q9207_005452 [Kuettlingeria erythrocarpa]
MPPRVRDWVDGSIVLTVSASMRYACITTTMNMIEYLRAMSNGDKFECTVSGLLEVAYRVPIKIMDVGIYPYEQDILPSVTTADSPLSRTGTISSVQILAQVVGIVGAALKNRSKDTRCR